jgi:predicted small secreted protein
MFLKRALGAILLVLLVCLLLQSCAAHRGVVLVTDIEEGRLYQAPIKAAPTVGRTRPRVQSTLH